MKRPTALLALLAALAGCEPTVPTADVPNATEATPEMPGTVRYVDVEGGCWAIELDGHERIQPRDLPQQFAKDGTRVLVRLESIPDSITTCQIGPVSRVLSIRLLE